MSIDFCASRREIDRVPSRSTSPPQGLDVTMTALLELCTHNLGTVFFHKAWSNWQFSTIKPIWFVCGVP